MKYGGCVYIITNHIQYSFIYRSYIWIKSENLRTQNKILFYRTLPQNIIVIRLFVWEFFKVEEAIDSEKQIKGGSRKDKEALIKSINPTWKDLWESIQDL